MAEQIAPPFFFAATPSDVRRKATGMPGETVLIAAYAARALTEAARRSGYVPLVADVFADDDTRAAAAHYRQIEGASTKGIRAKPILKALEALRDRAPTPPIGLVLGSGFEDKPRLMTLLADRYTLIGTPAAVVAEVKDPLRFADLLRRLAIPHPETQSHPPGNLDGWLSKLQGGTGGAHIHAASKRDTNRKRRYFQRYLDGQSYSLLSVVSKEHRHTWLSRQWVAPCPAAPFRYGGGVGVHTAPLMADMQRHANALIDALDLRGLVAFDFRISGGTAYLLEINPRPGATLDNFDRPGTHLFAAHVDAHLNGTFAPPKPHDDFVATALLYAREAALTMPSLDWPDWAADRTPAGTRIPPFAPIATVKAAATTPDAAIERAHARLAALEDLLYESPNAKQE